MTNKVLMSKNTGSQVLYLETTVTDDTEYGWDEFYSLSHEIATTIDTINPKDNMLPYQVIKHDVDWTSSSPEYVTYACKIELTFGYKNTIVSTDIDTSDYDDATTESDFMDNILFSIEDFMLAYFDISEIEDAPEFTLLSVRVICDIKESDSDNSENDNNNDENDNEALIK